MRLKSKQLGQGMTEYIIIVALIAISAIAVYNIFGDTVRGQVGDMAAELGGGEASGSGKTAGEAGKQEAGNKTYGLDDFKAEEK
ncbi:MAG: Flp pilus assembly pilin Flp [Bermanella sp.]|jgi:Flp pilus assembly pilin Flp